MAFTSLNLAQILAEALALSEGATTDRDRIDAYRKFRTQVAILFDDAALPMERRHLLQPAVDSANRMDELVALIREIGGENDRKLQALADKITTTTPPPPTTNEISNTFHINSVESMYTGNVTINKH